MSEILEIPDFMDSLVEDPFQMPSANEIPEDQEAAHAALELRLTDASLKCLRCGSPVQSIGVIKLASPDGEKDPGSRFLDMCGDCSEEVQAYMMMRQLMDALGGGGGPF